MRPFLEAGRSSGLEMNLLYGKALMSAGKYNEAVDILADTLKQYGLNAQTLNALGDAYTGLGNPGEAIKAFEKSLEIQPGQTEILAKLERLKK
jgi:Flp pilus assembly protein TadD